MIYLGKGNLQDIFNFVNCLIFFGVYDETYLVCWSVGLW
jgi:hypothetical protein